ncbi:MULTISPECIES: helix-turn-helix domain-containing protein [Bacillus]|uniref:HTH marR-type domain-containing protein n=2 Tax=Bacillus TaxID=1386 RepID=A0A0M4GA62_9BACI|nr:MULTISPECIES: hypothetical protein [Bacillus]ALC82365.1 hypothetical protein AM592_12805 [Bacillus gobiensis]MBP1081235.1 DNA-binding MarR family transcriptional regulator [Bacillus capparidis]MED1095915.1 MarR family transcriptional regulator [Bacillus capparidis]
MRRSISRNSLEENTLEQIKNEIETSLLAIMLRESKEGEEKQWLIEHCTNEGLVKVIQQMTVLMLHILDVIGECEPINGISISKKFGTPKGTVSKITCKLVQLELIYANYLENNKKEILYCTTSLGKELFQLHRELHKQIDDNFKNFLKKYDKNELETVTNFLKNIAQTSFMK